MKKYQIVARELRAFEQQAWWNLRLRRILKAAPLVVMFLLLNSRSAHASCSFNPTPDPTVDGSSNSLRAAIQAANASGQDCLIQLHDGTYTLSIKNSSGQENAAAEGDLDITDSGHTVTIQGKGLGVSIVNGSGLNGINDRVFQVLDGANAAFKNMTIEGGIARDDGTASVQPGTTQSDGGGLLVQDHGHVTLSNVWLKSNQAIGGNGANGFCTVTPSGGGGVASAAAGQAATGGGLFLSAGAVELTDSKMSGNAAMGGNGGGGASCSDLFGGPGANGGSGAGGGLYVLSGNAGLIRSTVSANTATGGPGGGGGQGRGGAGGTAAGGGIDVLSGTAGLSTSTVSANQVVGAPGGGGRCIPCATEIFPGGDGGAVQGAGLFIGAGVLSIRQTTISNNSATGGKGGSRSYLGYEGANAGGGSSLGAGIFITSANVSVSDSTLFANKTKGGPGGVGCHFCSTSIAPPPGPGGNAAGGGLYFSGGSVTLVGDTLASNHTLTRFEQQRRGLSSGGGIANISATSFAANMTLIGNNTQDSGNTNNGNDVSGPITSSYSLIGETAGATITDDGGNIFDVNPQLDPNGLQFNGGPTRTVALESGSPEIDVVPVDHCTDLASPPHPLTTDQRGLPRPDYGELVCDIGAYEAQETFAGQPGAPNCHGVSVSALTQQYGNISAAASALHFPSVQALQAAIRAFCGQ